jgi:probable HAF family extracellular repeat protein
MKRHQQTLDSHAPPSLKRRPGGGNAAPFDTHTIRAGYKIGVRTMTRKASRMLLAILLAGSSVPAIAQTTTVQQYRVSYLDDLGGTNSRGGSINNRGWIAGFSRLSDDQNRHATLWRDGSIFDLGTLGGADKNSSVVWPVKNTRGIIAGISQTDTPEPNGERWSCAAFFTGPRREGFTCLGFKWENGVMRRLDPLPGGNNSFATGADNKGQVVGWAENEVRDPAPLPMHSRQWRRLNSDNHRVLSEQAGKSSLPP